MLTLPGKISTSIVAEQTVRAVHRRDGTEPPSRSPAMIVHPWFPRLFRSVSDVFYPVA